MNFKRGRLTMSWTEIIKIQTTDSRSNRACLDYLAAFRQGVSSDLGCCLHIYMDAGFSSQVMVRVVWASPCPSGLSSRLAEVLIHELKSFGLVDHSSWNPK